MTRALRQGHKRAMRPTLFASLLVAVGFVCACSHGPSPTFGASSRTAVSDQSDAAASETHGPGTHARAAFAHALKTWTRSAKIYQQLDDKLFISATYHAPAFRRAFAVAFPDIYGHGGKITRRELVDLTGGIEQHHNFFVSIYTPDKRWNDIARDDSIWRLSLYSRDPRGAGNETEVAPDDIVPIKMDENLRVVYPYTTRFDKAYLVRFPVLDPLRQPIVHEGTQEVVMRIASAMGVASLRWQVHEAGLVTSDSFVFEPAETPP